MAAEIFSGSQEKVGPAPMQEPASAFGPGKSQPEKAASTEEETASQVLIAARFLQHHSGPLPAPEVLAAYERILPGLAERIASTFEKQLDHRMNMESRVIRSNTFSQRWSAVTGSMLAFCAVAGGLALAWTGHYAAGLGVFFTTLFAFLGTFVAGRKIQADERIEKLAHDQKRTSHADALAVK